jgi:putative nucleotidyltransferase with HDIG domain
MSAGSRHVNDPIALLAPVAPEDTWLVGGAVRDRLLRRPTSDFDVVVAHAPEPLARALAREARAHGFALSDEFGVWRVVSRREGWQVDVLPLEGDSIEGDLARRDFTVNAIAEPVAGGDRIDPFGGLDDVAARRLRMVSPDAFRRDPLRVMRLARLASELGFTVDPPTQAAAATAVAALGGVAPERVFTELKRIVASDRALEGLELMDSLGATAVVLPELIELRGVEQSRYHHLDVYEHTRAVLAEVIGLERDPEPAFGEQARPVAELLALPLADELTRGQALRFGALLHDIAKPQTRAVTPEGRITFIGHDQAGAELSAALLGRLRASERLAQYVAGLTRHHLRLGFLVHRAPLERRGVYRYLHATAPVQVDVIALSVADRLATRGSGSEEAIAKHLELARRLLGDAFAWLEHPPRPPLRGDELAHALGIGPGPEIGRILGQLEEDTFAGEVATPEQAVARARQLLATGGR